MIEANCETISGKAVRVIFSNASTRPTVTKLFHKQPWPIRERATFASGFSQKRLTRVIERGQLPRIDRCGSIHPYSVSGLLGVMPAELPSQVVTRWRPKPGRHAT